jgi:hypothetical protein
MEEATMNQKDPVFTAVQEDATSFCMDWPVFESDLSRENQFKGTVFVLDSAGARIVDTPLESPHNHSADEALNRIGWTRCGAWHRDAFGRQIAKVIAIRTNSGLRLPVQRTSTERIGSLAEEAALHLA